MASWRIVLLGHGVHEAGVRAHVRRGDVLLAPDEGAHRVAEAFGDLEDVLPGVGARIELDAALGASKGQLLERALDGHPAGERLDLVQVHLL